MDIQIAVRYKGNVVFTGPWTEAPGPVKDYIASAQKMYGDGLRDYLINRPEPVALLYKGYTYEVV